MKISKFRTATLKWTIYGPIKYEQNHSDMLAELLFFSIDTNFT